MVRPRLHLVGPTLDLAHPALRRTLEVHMTKRSIRIVVVGFGRVTVSRGTTSDTVVPRGMGISWAVR